MEENKIRRLRLAKAWSQEQLAEMASLSVRTVQRIENGEQSSLETLSALAAVFNTNVAELSEASLPCKEALAENIAVARRRLNEEKRFYKALVTAVIVCAGLFLLNQQNSPGNYWAAWVTGIWGTLLVIRAVRTFALREILQRWQRDRLQQLLRK